MTDLFTNVYHVYTFWRRLHIVSNYIAVAFFMPTLLWPPFHNPYESFKRPLRGWRGKWSGAREAQ